jgi:hypothetical protein
MSQAENANNTSRLSRRTALVGIAGAAAAAGAIPAIATEPDPIFAAIDEYRAALHARDVAMNLPFIDGVEHEEDTGEACHAEWEAFDALLETAPTTIAGVAAVLDILSQDPYDEGSYSSLAWAYNNGDPECPRAVATNHLMANMAATLRTMNGGPS